MDDRSDSDPPNGTETARGATGRVPEGSKSVQGKPRRRRRWGVLRWTLFVVFDIVVVLGVVLFVGGALLAGRDLPAPDWVAEEAGTFLSRGLGGGRAEVGAVTLRVEHRELPEIAFRDVRVIAPNGAELVTIPSLGVSLDKSALLERKVQPKALAVDGASLRLLRKADGTLDLGFGEGTTSAPLGSLDEAIAAVQQVFELPGLAPIQRIEVNHLDIQYADLRAARVWRVEDGQLRLDHDDDDLSISVNLTLPDDSGGPDTVTSPEPEPATVALRLSLGKESSRAEFSALVEGVAAADIAAQGAALSWLEPLDARASGALIARLTDDGKMGALNGTLEIGPGIFQPEDAARPIPFEGARAYFGFRPEQAKLTFEQLEFRGPDGSVSATGHAYLEGMDTGWPTALVAQLAFSNVEFNPPGLLPRPAKFDGGALDLKVKLNPFEARIGQLVLTTTDPEAADPSTATRFDATGQVTADDTGWHVLLDMGLDSVGVAPLMGLWPMRLVPGTRDWIERKLESGQIFNTRAGLRLDQGQRPDLSLTFEFRDAVLRPMATMPPITHASGYASTGRGVFALSLDQGKIAPPEGGEIDVAGSVFRIADVTQKPSTAEILWRSTSSATAALSLLDQEPFRFLHKAGKPVTLADAQAKLGGRISFPMKRQLTGADVDFDIRGVLTGASSEEAVPGRTLVSDRLDLRAQPAGLTIAGVAALDGVPLQGAFDLPLGREASDRIASVEGTIEIGETFVERFGIGLPEGSVRGAGTAEFRVDLPDGKAPAFSLTSGLRGVGLSLAPLGWSKGPGSDGSLTVSGRFGSPPSVDSLSLSGGGLSALGAVSLTPEGTLDRAIFSRVALGGWLDAPVILSGRGAGRTPAIAVTGGRIDIRKTSMGGAGGGSGGGGPPINLALDRLRISDSLALHGFRGEISQTGGMSGSFNGSLNGKAPVRGTLVPGKAGGTAVRVRSDDAGAVFKAAGIFGQASGGSMTLILQPRREKGEYDGQLKVGNIRVRSASGIAALANAISVVGLLDELNGTGITFTDVEALFRLTPSYVQVTRSSGVGPSLGISMEGVYDMVNSRMDMQGVFSPVYMVNSIGSLFTRKGEGLFGVTYRMRGSAANPSVEVNPLSALTPGMFREIFRAVPPKPRGGG